MPREELKKAWSLRAQVWQEALRQTSRQQGQLRHERLEGSESRRMRRPVVVQEMFWGKVGEGGGMEGFEGFEEVV